MPPNIHQIQPSTGVNMAKAILVPTKNLDEDHRKILNRKIHDDMPQSYESKLCVSQLHENLMRLSFFIRIFAAPCTPRNL